MIRAIVLSFVAGVMLGPQVNHMVKPVAAATMRYAAVALNIRSYHKIAAALP